MKFSVVALFVAVASGSRVQMKSEAQADIDAMNQALALTSAEATAAL